ncbi:MAG TPA: hypothetical protein ENH03_03530 [Candidatus Bathyarchaeota archaeon]|nr:hypothetical protein [Candidatus Bathyarchaeota archaeon]
MEEEKLKRVAELREILEKRIKDLEAEIGGLKLLLEFVNNLLLEKSFRKVEEIAPPKTVKTITPSTPLGEEAKVIPLKTSGGEVLANLYVKDGTVSVIPEADKVFYVNTPPFEAFLIEKVLAKMRDVDQEAVKRGELMPDEALSFDVRTDGNVIREIIIRNVTPRRERELRSAIRWTLEKMYEKTRSTQPRV